MVTLNFEGPRAQRRLTVAFRIILAIPHFFWAILLFIAGFFAVIAGWIAAVFIGRLPDGIREFLGALLQYWTRLNAYMYLMTDRYPPFSIFESADYPVTVELPEPTRLNRAAVLFRLILIIPAGFVAQFAGGGLSVALIVIWLIVLVAGRMPTSLWEAEAAVLRYEVRTWAYFGMLTPEYPRGLFGDKPQPVDPMEPVSIEPPSAAPRITRLVLPKAARRLVILFLVLGILQSVGSAAINAAVNGNQHEAADDLADSYVDLQSEFNAFYTEAQRCAVSGSGPECIQSADARMAAALEQFRAELNDIRFPFAVVGLAHDLEDDTVEMIRLLRQLAGTSDASTYQALAEELQNAGTRFDDDFRDLMNGLGYFGV